MARVYRFVCLCIVLMSTPAWGQLADHIVISECAPGGGSSSSSALYKQDWVELYNPTNAAIHLAGWTLQYRSSTGSGNYSVTITFGSVTMSPHSFYLVVGTSGGDGGADISGLADASASLVMGASGGRLALCNTAAVLASGSEASAANIVDFIGWGNAIYSEISSAPGASMTLTLERKARFGSTAASLAATGADAMNGNSCDSNNNSVDFVAQSSPSPQNSSASPVEVPSSSETRNLGGSTGSNYFILGDGASSYGVNIDVTSAGNAGGTTVSVQSAAAARHPEELGGKKIIDTYYTISSSASGIVYTLELSYLPSQYAAIKNPLLRESAMFLARRSAANTYQNFARGGGSIPASAANGMVRAAGATAFGDWFISADNSSPLPVELVNFTARMKGASIVLTWGTATELNNRGFGIERRSDRSSAWKSVGFVEGAGTCNTPNAYAFTDHSVTPQILAYRLKQIDNDGTVTYSNELAVDAATALSSGLLLDNYPNPCNPSTMIGFSVPDETWTTLDVYNSLGQRVAVLYQGIAEPGRYRTMAFDAARLAGGVYYARLTSGKKALIRKVMVAR